MSGRGGRRDYCFRRRAFGRPPGFFNERSVAPRGAEHFFQVDVALKCRVDVIAGGRRDALAIADLLADIPSDPEVVRQMVHDLPFGRQLLRARLQNISLRPFDKCRQALRHGRDRDFLYENADNPGGIAPARLLGSASRCAGAPNMDRNGHLEDSATQNGNAAGAERIDAAGPGADTQRTS